MFIQGGGFQTLQSKANDMNWDDDDHMNPPFKKGNTPPDDVPF